MAFRSCSTRIFALASWRKTYLDRVINDKT
jgi:hypothetical protein